MDELKALRGGVAPGGLFSKDTIRIMMCYLMKCLDAEISEASFCEILTETELANYFEIHDALTYLENSRIANVRRENGETYYSVTPLGIRIADSLYAQLPRSAREKAYDAGLQVLSRQRMRTCTDVEIRKAQGDNRHVVMTVYDENKTVMLQTTIYTADHNQAELIAKRFQTDPTKLYSAVLEALTE